MACFNTQNSAMAFDQRDSPFIAVNIVLKLTTRALGNHASILHRIKYMH